MSEQTNGSAQPGEPDEQRTPTFVGGAFGVTDRELEGGAADDPVSAFNEVEDHEDTGPDIVAASAEVPQTVQQDVSQAQTAGRGMEPGTETAQEPADVEGTTSEPSPGERNEPV